MSQHSTDIASLQALDRQLWTPASITGTAIFLGCTVVTQTEFEFRTMLFDESLGILIATPLLLTVGVSVTLLSLAAPFAPPTLRKWLVAMVAKVPGFVPKGVTQWASLVGVFLGYAIFLLIEGDWPGSLSAVGAAMSAVSIYMLAWITPHMEAMLKSDQKLRPWMPWTAFSTMFLCAAWTLVIGVQHAIS
jgi:hypothetical protein